MASASSLKLVLGDVKNKAKRSEMYERAKAEDAKQRRKLKDKRKRDEAEALAEGRELPKKIPRTIENTRKADETFVAADDDEVAGDEAIDEFAAFYENKQKPKMLITTSNRPRGGKEEMYPFVQELLGIFPNSVYHSRKGFPIKAICESAVRHAFTDLMILHEDAGSLNSLMLVHLPNGPTATFKLSSIVMPKAIMNHAKASNHKPEVILNHFDTRLGHRIGRMLGALFDQEPNFHGRRVVTFHNQRDFIFFRHHRYIFADAKTAKLQECGPRFTLKLQTLQVGLPDSKHAEYEFVPKKELGNSAKDFFL